MNFQCKKLNISNKEYGCTIAFSDDGSEAIKEVMHSKHKYLLVQRTYPEDEYDSDYYPFESTEAEIDLISVDTKIGVELDRERIKMDFANTHLEIGLDLTDMELKSLKEILEEYFKDRLSLVE